MADVTQILSQIESGDPTAAAPGSYTVQELAEAGWDLTNIQIVSGDARLSPVNECCTIY